MRSVFARDFNSPSQRGRMICSHYPGNLGANQGQPPWAAPRTGPRTGGFPKLEQKTAHRPHRPAKSRGLWASCWAPRWSFAGVRWWSVRGPRRCLGCMQQRSNALLCRPLLHLRDKSSIIMRYASRPYQIARGDVVFIRDGVGAARCRAVPAAGGAAVARSNARGWGSRRPPQVPRTRLRSRASHTRTMNSRVKSEFGCHPAIGCPPGGGGSHSVSPSRQQRATRAGPWPVASTTMVAFGSDAAWRSHAGALVSP